MDLINKYLASEREFGDAIRRHNEQVEDVLRNLNGHAPFFSVDCWIYPGPGSKCWISISPIAMFFDKKDADAYVIELITEIVKNAIQGDPRIQLLVNECKILNQEEPWRFAKFDMSVEQGYKNLRSCVEEFKETK